MARILKKVPHRVKKAPKNRDRIRIAPTSQIWIWPVLVIASLILAQLLKMPVSHMLFVFVLLLPLGTALQLLCAFLFIRTAIRSETDTVEKRTPVQLTAVIGNDCIIPFPFVEAELLLPDTRGAGCVPKRFVLPLHPLGGAQITRSIEFSFRGEYSVGIRALYVYDCFRTFCMHIPCTDLCEIFVLPRKMHLPDRQKYSLSELDTQNVIRASGQDNTELSDIRAYISGDSLKSIHWKLSSKSEELVVKDYSRNNGNSVCILCDLEPHYKNAAASAQSEPLLTPKSEYADVIDMLGTDIVVEICIACVLRELRAGNDVTLMWISEGLPVSVMLHSLSDFEILFRRFAAAPLDDREKQLTTLCTAHTNRASSSLILITGWIDPESTAEYILLGSGYMGAGSNPPEFMYCADHSLYDSTPESGKLLNDCLFELERTGMSVTRAMRHAQPSSNP